MKLTYAGLKDRDAFLNASIALPSYDPEKLAETTAASPEWVHFGIGNIFRIFIGSIADDLIAAGDMASGITCVETFDFEVVDKVYRPYDNLALCVTLLGDGTSEKRVVASLGEAIAARPEDAAARQRLNVIFRDPGLKMVSFTITEKGYALKNAAGEYFGFIRQDIENGPAGAAGAMALVTALLYERFLSGRTPLALVSMDNVSHNGEKLRGAVLEIAQAWLERGYVSEDFIAYITDESTVSFPWTMIDKITPRPSESVQAMLSDLGVEGMDIVITDKRTYIAPFVNAEKPQYLVVEDSFPNGRPPLEKGGVYMTDRDTVNACERMKVTVCLNPLHTALAPYGCALGYTRFSDVMRDPEMLKLVNQVGPAEGMAVVKDPGILSPKAFIEECINVRFPNEYIPDTPQRIAVDTSQMVGIRFGETIREYIARDGSAEKLVGIPLAIAGWLRYLLAVDENGNAYELSPDPMNEELQEMLKDIEIGKPETLRDQLKPILSNARIFGSDLYEAGIGELIEDMFRSEISEFGGIRKTIIKYLG